MTVTRDEFAEYLNLHAQSAVIDTRMKELSEKIKPWLREGRPVPLDLPYCCALQKRNQTVPDWKGAFFRHLKRLLGSEKKAEAKIEEVASRFEMREIEALVVKRNPDYVC